MFWMLQLTWWTNRINYDELSYERIFRRWSFPEIVWKWQIKNGSFGGITLK